jgi:DMSO/TMAO reductase YedYZ molybdopterin-dependent catalytic subunit
MVKLPPGQQLAARGKWPLVGERAPAGETNDVRLARWTVEVGGLVERPRSFRREELRAIGMREHAIDVHCVTRWSMLGVRFGGILLAELLDGVGVLSEARFVSFVADSDRGHSTSLPLADALALGVMLAMRAGGRPLGVEHGGPVRVVTPGRYFYKSLKWLTRIELLAEDRLGYWEQTAGYHNAADPWLEQHYLAPGLSRSEMAAALATRDWSGRDLRSIDAAGHCLEGLVAANAILRDANFRAARLNGANFAGANLSNAHLQRADLRAASFREADVEGANFCGADLRGADLTGASLVGVSFDDGAGLAARFNAATQFDDARLDDLGPAQAEFVRQRMASVGGDDPV